MGAQQIFAGLKAVVSSGVSFDATVAPHVINASTAPQVTLTNGNLTNGYIVAGLSCYNSGLVTITCLFDAGGAMTAMTKIATYVDIPTVGLRQIHLFGLAVGTLATGSYLIAAQGSAAIAYSVFSAASYKGVHQSVSVGTPAYATATSTTPSVTVSAAVNDFVIGLLQWDDTGSSSVGADQTSRWGAGGLGVGGALSDEAGAASVTHSYTIASQPWVLGGIALKTA